MKLGEVIDCGFDPQGYQRFQCCAALAACSICGRAVGLTAETQAWVVGPDGRMLHMSYGLASAACCGKVYVKDWDGAFVSRVPPELEAAMKIAVPSFVIGPSNGG